VNFFAGLIYFFIERTVEAMKEGRLMGKYSWRRADSGSNEGRTPDGQVLMENRIFIHCVIINTQKATGMA